MTLVYACIAPHGSELVPQLASQSGMKRFIKTRQGIRELARKVAASKPDTIVIASPHNLRLYRHIGVVLAENSTGSTKTSPRRIVSLRAKCNVEFAKALLKRAIDAGLPAVGANYGTSEGVSSDIPMDWGTLIPLWFFLRERRLRARIVIVTPSREIPLKQNVEFGRVIGELAEDSGQTRFVFVASADQAHVHSKSGPYGFSSAASLYDGLVVEAIEKDRFPSIMNLGSKLVEQAKPDSLWQMAMLVGIAETIGLKPRLLSYEVPTYYGMICAGFERIR